MSLPVELLPQQDGWVKYFCDGTVEYGYDQDVDLGRSSWTRGKQDKMCAVALKAGSAMVFLTAGEGESARFWQSDDYEVVLGHRNPVRITRRIEQKLGDKTWKIVEIDLRTSEIKEYISKHKI